MIKYSTTKKKYRKVVYNSRYTYRDYYFLKKGKYFIEILYKWREEYRKYLEGNLKNILRYLALEKGIEDVYFEFCEKPLEALNFNNGKFRSFSSAKKYKETMEKNFLRNVHIVKHTELIEKTVTKSATYTYNYSTNYYTVSSDITSYPNYATTVSYQDLERAFNAMHTYNTRTER